MFLKIPSAANLHQAGNVAETFNQKYTFVYINLNFKSKCMFIAQ